MTINDRLKVVRTNLGLSQQKFADKLGMSCNFINLCENGKRELSERTIKDIGAVFNVNLEWLKTGEGEMFDEESEDVVIDALRAEYDLDEIDIDIIRTYISMAPLERQVFKNFIKSVSDKNKGER
jgi:transcriptional regulator with XRE-family HTH domain